MEEQVISKQNVSCIYISCAVLLISLSANAEIDEGDSLRYHVALVDRFYPGDACFDSSEDEELNRALYGMVDLDRDDTKETLYHGDIVASILKHPDIKIVRYPLRSGIKPINALLEQLELIRRDIFWGASLDAVLLPWESSTLIKSFEMSGDQSLKPERVDFLFEQLAQLAQRDRVWHTTLEIIQALEDIVDYGGLVYTIAGNGGARMINTYSFAEGAVTVGAVKKELAHFVSNNVFVDTHAPAAYLPQLIVGQSGHAIA